MYRPRVLLVGLLVLAAALAAVVLREVRRSTAVGEGPRRAGGRVERCLTCHSGPAEDPGGVHASEALGCSSCHLGNPLAFDETRAHEGMEPNPGALETVDRTCGQDACHGREAGLVKTSLMATNRGLVSVDRWAFGEQAEPTGMETLGEVLRKAEPTPAEDHLRRLCAGCHLGARPDNRDDAIPRTQGAGCAACHAPVRPLLAAPADKGGGGTDTSGPTKGGGTGGSAGRTQSLSGRTESRSGRTESLSGRTQSLFPEGRRHPPIAGPVPADNCLGCHSRSGRISLSYQGLAEVQPGHAEGCEDLVGLYDGRLGCRLTPDVHHEAGMACTDCHLHTEVMGDGKRHAHAEQQVELTCEACHVPAGERTTKIWAEVTDPITDAILRLRGQARPPAEPVRTGTRGTPVWNLRPLETEGAPWTLFTKDGTKRLPSKATPADPDHRMKGHQRLTCVSCHAAWAPTCASCHVRYDPSATQWSFAASAPVPGAWRETSEGFDWAPPTMSVTAEGRIYPAVPGMIMDLDAREAGGPLRSVRYYAPLDPHTTRTKARSCASCHRDPVALGLGTGALEIDATGVRFRPAAPTPEDPHLAQDGWTTLYPKRPGVGTRPGLRSLTANEQHRVLRVGACVTCHAKATDPVWGDFDRSLARLKAGGTRCPFPPAPWLYAAPEAD